MLPAMSVTPNIDPSIVNAAIVDQHDEEARLAVEGDAIVQTDNGLHDDDPADQPEQNTEVQA